MESTVEPDEVKAESVPDTELDYTMALAQPIYNATERSNIEMRKMLIDRMTKLFVITNVCVVAIVIVSIGVDLFLIRQGNLDLKDSGQRLIDKQVLLALIGATTVQLGGIAYMISSYLFPKSK